MSDTAILITALTILGLPILSYGICFFFGSKLPRRGDWLAVILLFIAEFLALRIFFHFWQLGDPGYRVEGEISWSSPVTMTKAGISYILLPHLEPGADYEIQVAYDDPDGVSGDGTQYLSVHEGRACLPLTLRTYER